MRIDIGAEAIDRTKSMAGGFTFISKDNPANANGIINSVEIRSVSYKMTGCKVGIFYTTNENTLRCRSAATIGDVLPSGKRTFSVSLPVQAGDYIGAYWAGGYLERDLTGYQGVWCYTGRGDRCVVGDEAIYEFFDGDAFSLYGTGEEAAPPVVPPKLEGWLPMPPNMGPPLPRFLQIFWPFYKE